MQYFLVLLLYALSVENGNVLWNRNRKKRRRSKAQHHFWSPRQYILLTTIPILPLRLSYAHLLIKLVVALFFLFCFSFSAHSQAEMEIRSCYLWSVCDIKVFRPNTPLLTLKSHYKLHQTISQWGKISTSVIYCKALRLMIWYDRMVKRYQFVLCRRWYFGLENIENFNFFGGNPNWFLSTKSNRQTWRLCQSNMAYYSMQSRICPMMML